jgi:hypothetical protein
MNNSVENQNVESIDVENIIFSAYMISNRFLNTVIEKQGKNDLIFREKYNYRNLRQDNVYEKFQQNCCLPHEYTPFLERVINYYISAIGPEKFKRCLDDEHMNISTLFDEKDFFIDCKDVLDYWLNHNNGIVTAVEDSNRYEFAHYLMEELNDRYNNPDDQPLKKGELFYIFRETDD